MTLALASQLPQAASTSAVFVLVAVGIGIVAGIDGTGAVIGGLVLLGMGNGTVTLARATVIADRYGSAAYGTVGGVAAAVSTAARAAGPVAGAAWAAAVGFAALLWTLAALAALGALLAYRAERAQT